MPHIPPSKVCLQLRKISISILVSCDECFHSLFIETDNLLLLFWKCSLFTLKHFFFRNLNVWINNMAIKVGKLWKIIAYTFSTHNFLSIVLPYFLNVARQNSVYHITEQCRHTWQSAKSSMFDCIMTCLLKRKCSWAIEISTSFIDQMESGILLMFDHSKFTILETTSDLFKMQGFQLSERYMSKKLSIG